jgi:hypothetical protein
LSVVRTDFIMIGLDIGDNLDWDEFQAEIEGASNARFDAVPDGMCGEYCMVGKTIAWSDQYEGWGILKLEPKDFEIDRVALAKTLSDALKQPITADDLSLIIFSNYG